ncbi:MAG TPA: HAMP domain-containing sensor histidine kinase [Bacteroidales bacterium]|jgi:signal transduction histidine kinase|nr:HAMP domain-containing sensor histidine kinase [Bacteroidales bacterium]
MIRLKTKLALFNLLSKLAFTALFLLFLPMIIERINLRQVDNDLVQKREKTIGLISQYGIEPFINPDSSVSFGSYNILKEEFISLEKTDFPGELNEIDISSRILEDEEISYRVLNYTLFVDGQKYLLEIGRSLTSIQQAKRNISRILFIFIGLIILITFITDLQYTRLILVPLEKITKKLSEISSPSKFDKTPVKTNTIDFASLDNALRSLMDRIGEAFRKEKEITVDISHELLTPVSVLRSKLENILLSHHIDQEVAGKVEESLKTLHRLQSLVNSLLMIARIESHQYLREDTFSVKMLIEEIIEELKPLAEDKEVALTGHFQQDLIFSDANRPLIFSMFYNIVSNAVKNTPSGGEINIKCVPAEKCFSVVISDTGKGMDDEQLAHLFSRFKSRKGHDENGAGIGLAIAKSIADFHKIKIQVKSTPGSGTEFSFDFPRNS